ncbi:transcriptional regulator [Paenibacillus swuensis]|uniref:Transcriptional regulator n=1 Tax=Paenibacillus swuensis TaxID=1178515 RepID=A0A172TEC8_9BACL|nr:LCP family protein [Paenibacillus swuensis]ANE45398.1 transcriptional regulator [Paenibacillus swuensis]
MRRTIKWGVSILSLIIIAFVAYYGYGLYNAADKFSKDPDTSRFGDFIPVKEQEPPKWEGQERVNILILGGDERGLRANETPRSDSMMVASLDPVTKKGFIFSILRDTYVDIPEHRDNRVNVALTLGGPELAMKTVSDYLGIPIQYYLYTDFQGFIALVDSIGGIDLDVEKDMHYVDAADDHVYDIDLKKGLQHLDGKKSLQYVRFRHDAQSDFTRTERQRKFLKAVADKMQTTTSLMKLPDIMSDIAPYVETNLSVTDMLKLGRLGYESKASGVETVQIPPSELIYDDRVGGASVLRADEDKLRDYVQELFEAAQTPPETEPAVMGGNDGVDIVDTVGTLAE